MPKERFPNSILLVEPDEPMRISKLKLKNFRSCVDTDVELAEDLTVLVGENASGKTAIIDALRITTTSVLEQKGSTYSVMHDPSIGAPADQSVEISATYEDLTEGQKAVFLTQLVDEDESLRYKTMLSRNQDIHYWKVATHVVGELGVEDAEPANRKRIAHIYLPPLRDAVRELDSGTGERLAEVLKVLTTNVSQDRLDFINDANGHVDSISALKLAEKARDKIEEHLSKITPPSRTHQVRFGGRHQELRRLAGLMRIQLADARIDPLRLASSGLGYANLVYIATIVLQLANAKDYDLTLLLVEEPEAHLHPQLQSVLLEYLHNEAEKSRAKPESTSVEPEGRVQVVVSTHSPNLASSVSIENVVIVSRHEDTSSQAVIAAEPAPEASTDIEERDDIDDARDLSEALEAATESIEGNWITKTTSVKDLDLKPTAVRKLNRYLSATRSSLLFARHVVLVEGIAESVLIPEIAKKLLFEKDHRALQHIVSTSFVAVDGVDFEPYLKLLLTGPYSRVDKVIVITDGDPDKTGKVQGAERKLKYENLFKAHVESGKLAVYHGDHTLEADMFAIDGNEVSMKASYLTLHPLSEQKWDDLFEGVGNDAEIRAALFAKEIRTKEGRLDLGKGEFSQLICEGFEAGLKIIPPTYITEAITDLVGEMKTPTTNDRQTTLSE